MVLKGKYQFAGRPLKSTNTFYTVEFFDETNQKRFLLVPEDKVGPFRCDKLEIIIFFDPEQKPEKQFVDYQFADEESSEIWRLMSILNLN